MSLSAVAGASETDVFPAIAVLKHNVAGPAQMEELRRLRARLEGAMKITEVELQQSVFK